MSSIRIPTSFNIDLEFDIPEFHRRFFAWIIDTAIIVLYWILAARIATSILSGSGGEEHSDAVSIAWEITGIPITLYFLLSEVWMNGQTLGKKAMRIRVVNMNGGKPTLGQFVIRWLLRIVDFPMTLCLGGLLSVIFTKYSQRLGDLAAGTILIATNAKAGLEETVFMETAQDYVPQFPQVMRLSDRDLNTIRSLLERARGSDNFNIAATAAEKIKTVLKIETPLTPFEFLETLLMDYNYISVQ